MKARSFKVLFEQYNYPKFTNILELFKKIVKVTLIGKNDIRSGKQNLYSFIIFQGNVDEIEYKEVKQMHNNKI